MTEREHHAWGALLKYLEAHTIAYRYDRYPRNSKTGKKFDRLLKATRELREQLSYEYGRVATEHLVIPEEHKYKDVYRLAAWKEAVRSDVYQSDELDRLKWFVMDYLDGGPCNRALRWLGIPVNEYQLETHAQFQHVVNKAITATQSLPSKPSDWLLAPPPSVPTPLPKANHHADLRAALIENPDQPQAAFVRRFRVHPITVKRCRRELEETGAIPVLEHRHGPARVRDDNLASMSDPHLSA